MNMRRGICLTEVLVVMGTSTVALLGATQLLRQAMTQQRYAEEQCHVHRVAERLTTRFRQDVHAARSAQWIGTAGEGELHLRLPANAPLGSESEVRYAVNGREVTRVVRPLPADGQQGPTGPTHRDSFLFPDDYRIELHEWESPTRLQLLVLHHRLPQQFRTSTVAESTHGDAGARTIAHVLAIVGKHVESSIAAIEAKGDPS